MNGSELLDQEQFLEEYEDSMDIIEMMLPKFEKAIEESIVKIGSYLQEQKAHDLKEELHALKGVVGNFYSPFLSAQVVTMEDHAREENLSPIHDMLETFKEDFPKVIQVVSSLVEKHSA